MTPAETQWLECRALYDVLLPLLHGGCPGKWMLLYGGALHGLYDSQGEAVSAGRKKFGYVPLYTRQVVPDDSVPVTE